MTRTAYQEDLADLRSDVAEMGDLVGDQLQLGLDALAAGDEELARAVRDGDEAVNERYLALESECIRLIAGQQPVASDLRFIAASFKITTDLERIGDLATNLGKYTLQGSEGDVPHVDVGQIGDRALVMLGDAIEAYTAEDADACFEIAARDDELDELCVEASDAVVRQLLERRYDILDDRAAEGILADVRRLLLTVRDLERVGDHCVNIAARSLYMAEADDSLLY